LIAETLAWRAEATLQGQIAEVIELRENGRVSVRFDNGRLLMGRNPDSFERVAGLGVSQGEMSANALPSVFTIEIGGTPTLTFEAQNLREAHELCHEEWLKADLAEATSDGAPLWDGKAKLRARIALPDERALFAEATNRGQPSDELMLVYLVELDVGEIDEQPVDPGAFPPARS
jgi:hypothetical protein